MNRRTQIEIQEVRDVAALRALAPEWDQLWECCPGATTFQRPEWLICWMETFHPGELWTLAARDQGRLVGLAPLYIQAEASTRNLAHIGLAISDYLDWLLVPETADQALAAMVSHMRQADAPWTTFDFSDVPSHSPLLEYGRRQEYEVESRFHDACPVLQLPPSVEELRNVVPHHQWRSLKSARKKILKLGEARVEIATRETLPELLEALFRLHQIRWSESGQAGVFANAEVRKFHQHITPVLLEKGVLRLYGLRLNGQIIASLYALFERDIAYCYLQGFDPQFADLSPGAQMVAAVTEDAIRQHKRSMDFLRGGEAYKYAWGARDVPTYRLRGSRSSLITQIPSGRMAA